MFRELSDQPLARSLCYAIPSMNFLKLLYFFLFALSLALLQAHAESAPTQAMVKQLLAEKIQAHPRLFLKSSEEAALKQKIANSPELKEFQEAMLNSAEKILSEPPVERVLTGKRLLTVSRQCLHRVLFLGMAWRLTGDARFLNRAKVELLAAASFTDWHPEHFLDVAEMTAAEAIGYDWFYSALDSETRRTVKTAIVEKGLKPSLKGQMSWVRGGNNWNQVCNGGMVLGALAVADEEPDLAAQIIARAIDSLPYVMKEYAPDGAFPEGPNYWDYGTTYNVMLIAAMQSALGTDFGLVNQPGFLASGDFLLHDTGPTGLFFNYSDSVASSDLQPALYWIAQRRPDEPGLLWFMDQDMHDPAKALRTDVSPLALIWSDGSVHATQPKALDWTGAGANPVAFFRSGWTPDALFVGMKAGSPSVSHAHMDVGSFVFDALGVRWADSLGMQSYNTLESKGIALFNMKQDSQRWQIFRLSNQSKNMIVINGGLQNVAGKAGLVTHDLQGASPSAEMDCSTIFAGQAQRVVRTITLPQRRSLIVDDLVTSVAKDGTVRWQMMTSASVALAGSSAELTQQGKKLVVKCLKPANANWSVLDASKPVHSYDAANPGQQQLILDVPVHAGDSPEIQVSLEPQY